MPEFRLAVTRPALLATVVTALVAASEARSQSDNVLVLIADDVGVDNVGIYGEGPSPPPTPNIDALARRGVLFRNVWTNPVCSPTRGCLHTGRYATRTGVGGVIKYTLPRNQNVLPLAEVTLPEILDARRSGYSHALIGKWHLTDQRRGGELAPNLAGWSHFAGILDGKAEYFNWPRTVNGQTQMSTVYSTTQMVDDALAWIDSAPGPWVMYLSFNAPHNPWHAPPTALHTQQLAGLSPKSTPTPFYKAMLQALDTEIGRLLATLGPKLARTNVIFMGDNGTPQPAAQAPFVASHGKGTAYEGGLNVPLIVAGPAVLQGVGREEAALVSAVDLVPTIAELCGVDAGTPFIKMDGVSFVPYLRSAQQPPLRSTVFGERFRGAVAQGSTNAELAIRNARYKLYRLFTTTASTEEFYDLSVDPFETNNLLLGTLTPEQQTNRDALSAEVAAIRSTNGSLATYGTAACVGSNGVPTIGGVGTPTIGAGYSVQLQNGAITRPAVLVIGGSKTQCTGLALPFPLARIGGAASCSLLGSAEAWRVTATGSSGRAAISVALPNIAELVSGSIYHYWLVLDPDAPANPLGVTTSDGLHAVVGR